jgi:hypothetical protein
MIVRWTILLLTWLAALPLLWILSSYLIPTAKGNMPAVFDPKLERLQTNRYEDLTAAELVSMLEGATRLRVNGDEDRAERIMRASLDLEHFISVIPLDPAQVPASTLDEIRQQRDALVALIGRGIPLHLFSERVSDQVAES